MHQAPPPPLVAMRKADSHLRAAAELLSIADEGRLQSHVRSAIGELRAKMRSRAHSAP